MALAAFLTDLQAETICLLCSEHLKDPVIIDCGHIFCHPCLYKRWEGLLAVFPCPVCLHHCTSGKFTKKPQIGHMMDSVKPLSPRKSKRTREMEEPRCDKHNLLLALFCEEDLELLCPQCVISSNHQGHLLVSIQQGADHHRKKLWNYMNILRRQEEETAHRAGIVTYQLDCVEENIHSLEQYSHLEYRYSRYLLQKEYHDEFFEWDDVELKAMDILSRQGTLLSDLTSEMNHLLHEVLEKCGQADAELVADVDSIHKRHDDLREPVLFSVEIDEDSWCLSRQHFGLQTIIHLFKVDLTLNPDRADPDLIILEDRRVVMYGKMTANSLNNPETFTSYPCVLATEALDAGRHFWQVQISGTGEWALGVSRYCETANDVILSSQDVTWLLQDQSPTDGLHETHKVMLIGIFLDFELGEMSYYDMETRSHLQTVTGDFTGKLWPCFAIGSPSTTLTISSMTDD
ncbi:tripartite motif-containing protein 60-like [Rhynchocyon petersi]